MSHYQAVVIGAGAAGLTAGIYLSRARISTLIVDSGMAGGQMVLTHMVANYPGVMETSGALLARIMVKQAKLFGCIVKTQAKLEITDLKSSPKVLTVNGEKVTADVVILANGGSPRKLGFESEERLAGKGISYCATCDGDFFTGLEIVAIGGGNSALEEAVSLSKYASKVTIIHEFDHFQAFPWAVEEAKNNPKINFIMNQKVLDFEGEEKLSGVKIEDKVTGKIQTVSTDGCFIFIGYVPRTENLKGHVELNNRGEIITDDSLMTSVDGVFAAGDCRVKKYRQITTAVSDGTIAALSAIEKLHMTS